MVLEQAKDGWGRVILAGLHQKPDATNMKNFVGYPGNQTANLVRRNVYFYYSWSMK